MLDGEKGKWEWEGGRWDRGRREKGMGGWAAVVRRPVFEGKERLQGEGGERGGAGRSGEERRGAKRSEKYRGEGMYGSSVTKDLAYITFIMPLRRQYPVSNPSDRIES